MGINWNKLEIYKKVGHHKELNYSWGKYIVA